jgi:hypothetical protein
MSRRSPALDNPVARKEGEAGAGAGHPARARSGRLIYGRERRNIDYPVEKKPEEEKDRSLERTVPHLRALHPITDSARAGTKVRRVLSKERKEEERETAYRVSSRLAGRADKEDSKHHQ